MDFQNDNFEQELIKLFKDPNDFYLSEPPNHFDFYERKDKNCKIKKLRLRLLGKSPLWGHLLWNAGKYSADFLDLHSENLVKNKKICELGSGSGLPSLISYLNNAELVVCSDYPDVDLIKNLEYNFDQLIIENNLTHKNNFKVLGYIWGNNVTELFSKQDTDEKKISEHEKFDLVILSDLIFNHSEHLKLLSTCRKILKKNGKCLVVFTPHRPHLLKNDLDFFTKSTNFQFKPEIIEIVNWKPMFEEDNETYEIRSRIYSYFLIPTW